MTYKYVDHPIPQIANLLEQIYVVLYYQFARLIIPPHHSIRGACIKKASANALHFGIGFGGRRDLGLGSRAGQF